MKQHILSNIHTNTFNYTAAASNQNPSSAIARYLLDNPACVEAYNPTIFTFLEPSINELQLSILKALLNINQNCIFTNYFIHHLFLTTHMKKILLAEQTLAYGDFFRSVFFPPPRLWAFLVVTIPYLLSLVQNYHGHNFLKRSDRNNGSPF